MYRVLVIILMCIMVGCSDSKKPIVVDGSSTVYPITEAVAESYQKKSNGRVVIGVSGTGGGFKKFCRNETDINNASRRVKEKEFKLCSKNGVKFIELIIAYDGISVVVNKQANWVDYMSVFELKKLWEPKAQRKVLQWNHIRSDWPNREIHLFGPGADSGTYDYFTKTVVGKEHSSRGDFTSSEDDNVLVQGVSTDPLSLGFFGFAYYHENRDKLKIVPIKYEEKISIPSFKTINNGTYKPLSRPLYLYVNVKSLNKNHVKNFIDHYLTQFHLVKAAGYVPLPKNMYKYMGKKISNIEVFTGK